MKILTQFSHIFPTLQSIDKGLLEGRKYMLGAACCLPAASIAWPTFSVGLNLAFMAIGAIALVANQVLSTMELTSSKAGVSICHKVIAYCFAIVPGPALTLELMGAVNPVIAAIAGIGVSVFFSMVMYSSLEREWS